MSRHYFKTTGITKNEGKMIPPKEQNKLVVTDLKEMKITNHMTRY